MSGARLIPDHSLDEIQGSDLIIVSSILDIERTLKVQREVIDWLIECHRGGAHIATVCSGAFVLAETGLLDGKTATTHWGYADQFKRRYPKIDLQPQRLITDEGDLFCSGGLHAGIDLSLYLLEKADRSFDEITCRVGYGDSGAFRKVFMKQTGLSPTEYRRTFQKRSKL